MISESIPIGIRFNNHANILRFCAFNLIIIFAHFLLIHNFIQRWIYVWRSYLKSEILFHIFHNIVNFFSVLYFIYFIHFTKASVCSDLKLVRGWWSSRIDHIINNYVKLNNNSKFIETKQSKAKQKSIT